MLGAILRQNRPEDPSTDANAKIMRDRSKIDPKEVGKRCLNMQGAT